MVSLLVALHVLAAVASLAALALGLGWGVWEYQRRRLYSRAYDRILWVAQSLLLAQVAAGAAALLAGREPRDPWHIVFGSLAASLLPLVWYAVQRLARPSLAMALACAGIIVAGVAAVAAGA